MHNQRPTRKPGRKAQFPPCPPPISQERDELLEGSLHFRLTFDQAAVGMAHMSRDGHLQLVNWRFCDILGYAREELMQQGFLDITHPEDVQEDLSYFKAALAGKSDPHIRETPFYFEASESSRRLY